MPRDKSDTRVKILKSAKPEFLKHGFEKASIRTIAKNAGVTAGAIYKHFPAKADLFYALTEPAFEKMMNMDEGLTDDTFRKIRRDGLDEFRRTVAECNRTFLNFFYDHLEELHLIFNCSVGTKFENVLHDLVMREVEGGKQFIAELKRKGIEVNDLTDDQLHLLFSTTYAPFFEIITHGYSYEEAQSFTEIMTAVMNFSWRQIIKYPDG